ncbi:MAG: diacylglycerol kinase family lipid kinase [Verrucomicrobia bacterium]|nr:diacylglycerol kinase family lipid kinase [Verrucomicrobiota bacterium]
MRACVIFNPTAKGNKARHFRHGIGELDPGVTLKPTQAPGDAQRLASEAVRQGYDTIVAAGGDGTVNEVINGIADTPSGFVKARLAVLPLGTVNVFARELGLPLEFHEAWRAMLEGREKRIDVGFAEYATSERTQRRYFVQLAGAGLDARAISLVHWGLKKRIGPLAYVVAGAKAMRSPHPQITVEAEGQSATGELVLVGNGRFYGGSLPVFPDARLDDGLLDICVFPRVSWVLITRYALGYVTNGPRAPRDMRTFQAARARLTASVSVPFQVEGDLCGMLPVTLGVLPNVLRVVAEEF